MTEESSLLHKGPCAACGSSDANAHYSDGHTHCFSCGGYTHGGGTTEHAPANKPADFIQGDFKALLKRGISVETCRLFGYRTALDKGQAVQVADYHDALGHVVAQKIRYPDKTFRITGTIKTATLFGQKLWRDAGNKVVITEGELDAMSVSQVQDNRWPVVSIPTGADGAAKALKKNLEWLLGFKEIILLFDDDEAGRGAVEACATLFPPGRCKVATILGFKDASDALQAKQRSLIIDAIWSAKTYRPDGIVGGEDLWAAVSTDDPNLGTDLDFPWAGLQTATLGARRAELVMLLAGSGIGKSTILREFVVSALNDGETVGGLFLEETTKRTMQGIVGVELSKPLHLDRRPFADLSDDEREERRAAFDRIGGGTRLHLYDHFGSTGEDGLLTKLRYLVQGLGCSWIFLDHISIVVSGMEDGGDERKLIDRLMTKLRTFVNETGCGLFVVCHLARPKDGKGHEEGGEVRAGQARGSHALIQLSDTVIGFERDQQSETMKNVTSIRLIKCRITGESGIVDHLLFDKFTGRLTALSPGDLLKMLGKKPGGSFGDETTNPGEF